MSVFSAKKSGYEALISHAVKNNIPLGVHLDLTYRCELSCVHCYLTKRKLPELTLEQIESFLVELKDMGGLFLLVSGGDPFIRTDLIPILHSMRKHRFDVRILTHGGNITPEIAIVLEKLAISRVGVSVYSDNPEIHDSITGKMGSYYRTLRGIRLLRERRVPVLIKCMVFKTNKGTEITVPKLAHDLDCACEVGHLLRPANDGSDHPVHLSLSEADRIKVEGCRQKLQSKPEEASSLSKEVPVRGVEVSLDEITCYAGHSSCYVNPSGEVQPCLDWEVSCGSLVSQNFREIWEDSEYMLSIRKLRRANFKACRDCKHIGTCNLCPAASLRETGSTTGRAPGTCQLTSIMDLA